MHLHSTVGSALPTCTLWLEESATTIELSGPTAIPLGQVKHPGPLPRLPILKRSCLFCMYWLLRVVPTSAKPPENFINSGYAYALRRDYAFVVLCGWIQPYCRLVRVCSIAMYNSLKPMCPSGKSSSFSYSDPNYLLVRILMLVLNYTKCLPI